MNTDMTQSIIVVLACLVQVAGILTSWQWQVAASLGAIFLVLVAIWLRLTQREEK